MGNGWHQHSMLESCVFLWCSRLSLCFLFSSSTHILCDSFMSAVVKRKSIKNLEMGKFLMEDVERVLFCNALRCFLIYVTEPSLLCGIRFKHGSTGWHCRCLCHAGLCLCILVSTVAIVLPELVWDLGFHRVSAVCIHIYLIPYVPKHLEIAIEVCFNVLYSLFFMWFTWLGCHCKLVGYQVTFLSSLTCLSPGKVRICPIHQLQGYLPCHFVYEFERGLQ